MTDPLTPPPADIDEIVSLIADEEDKKVRTLLSVVFKLFSRLEKKFDLVLRDEQALRQAVLNGHAGNHSTDHDEWGEFKPHIPRVLAACNWVDERIAHGGMCPWGAAKIEAEKADAVEHEALEQVEAAAKVKHRYDLKTAVVTAIISIVAMGIATMVFGTHTL